MHQQDRIPGEILILYHVKGPNFGHLWLEIGNLRAPHDLCDLFAFEH